MERTRWDIVALIFGVGLFAAAQFGKFALTLPEVARLYGRSEAGLSWLVSVVGLVGLIFGAMAGVLVARFGARRALLWALLGAGALSVAQAVLPNLALMGALRILEGAAHLAIVVAAPPLMAAAASGRDRPIAMAIWAMFFGLSFAISALLFPVLIAWGGLGLLFLVHGAGLWILALLLIPRLPPDRPEAQRLRVISLHIQTYSSLRICLPGLGFVFYTVTFVALLTFLPLALARPELALTLPLISLVATLGAGLLCKRIAPDRVVLAGFLLGFGASLGLAAGLPFAPELAFVALGLVPGASFAAIPHFNASAGAQSRATGAIAQLGNLGTTTGTPIFAALLSQSGLAGVLVGLGGFCLAGALVVFWLGQRLRRENSC